MFNWCPVSQLRMKFEVFVAAFWVVHYIKMVNIKDISEEFAVSFFRVCNGKASEVIYKHVGLSQINRPDQLQFVILAVFLANNNWWLSYIYVNLLINIFHCFKPEKELGNKFFWNLSNIYHFDMVWYPKDFNWRPLERETHTHTNAHPFPVNNSITPQTEGKNLSAAFNFAAMSP